MLAAVVLFEIRPFVAFCKLVRHLIIGALNLQGPYLLICIDVMYTIMPHQEIRPFVTFRRLITQT